MRVLAWDSETALIRPAWLAPELVCVTWQMAGQTAGIEHALTVEGRLRSWLEDDDLLLVGHNVAFDFAVIVERFPKLRPLIFRAYRMNRVTDTMIRQQLLDIAGGVYRGWTDSKGQFHAHKYDLKDIAQRKAGMYLTKDAWRLSYAEFLHTPLSKWPERAVEVQEIARRRLLEIDAQFEAAQAAKNKKRTKALTKERNSLLEMIHSDPSRCTEYPLDDARATLAVFFTQEKHAQYLADQFRQTRAAFALYLSSCWGICVDEEGVKTLKASAEREREELEEELVMLGLVRENGTMNMKAAKARMLRVCRDEGLTLVRTETHFKKPQLTLAERKAQGLKPRCKKLDGTPLDDGDPDCEDHVCLDTDACERSGDDVLANFAERKTLTKQLTTDIPLLEKGILYPIHTRYGMAATGRSTSSRPNLQNQSKRDGFREAFLARPGMLFAECDYPYLELFTLAQCCITWFGKSKLAETILAGRDPHMAVAATILQKTYEWCEENKHLPAVKGAIKRARNLAKPANFGFPGGMGIPKFVSSTRKAIIKLKDGASLWAEMDLTEGRARRLKKEWTDTYPEMEEHFARVSWLCNNDNNRANVETLFTGRFRGDATFCATANNGFQALGADCAKNAAWLIAEAQYNDRNSPLFNTRTVAFVHDEFIIEVPDNNSAHDAAYALAERMVAGANEFLPDVPIPLAKMEPLLMKRWAKAAEARFDGNGRLIQWAA